MKNIKKHSHDLVYRKGIIGTTYSPPCIYLPTRNVMFKLMRACIGVKYAGDLWFN